MTNQSNNNTNSGFMGSAAVQGNSLMQYVRAMEPATIEQLSRPVSGDVLQAMEHNIKDLVTLTPSIETNEQQPWQITTLTDYNPATPG